MHFHAGKCQLMQGIFQKENTDKALKYGIYRHLPTYEKIIRNLVSFSFKSKNRNVLDVRASLKVGLQMEQDKIPSH
ncbi:hypothetical protein DW740_10780 [Blautia obeum]|uniref:Uncharacterized protein n=1 Tax=Blautia obeum TaxID=40520 RepID=A0A414J462_9FIRM|nr:hypothetical protein DW740_10780 [Blautia obeum]